jgi:hypothetical protein
MAERAIREIKLRMSIHLDFEGTVILIFYNKSTGIMRMFRGTPG